MKFLGGLSIFLLVVAVALSVFALTGRHSKKVAVLVSGTVLTLLITVTVFCIIIYVEYKS